MHVPGNLLFSINILDDLSSDQFYNDYPDGVVMSHLSQNFTAEKKPKLLDQVRLAIRTKHYSLRTEESYVSWIKRFILFHSKRHPREMGEVEINQFLTHLAVNKKVSASTQNQALCAIVFLYKHVLGQELGDFGDVVWAKRPKRLPVVFTPEEVKAVMRHLDGIRWIMANLLYGAGLRLMECLRLRVNDIDFGYKQITVRDTKGHKDRVTMLPEIVIELLQQYLRDVSTMMIYTHVLNRGGMGIKSPADFL